MIIIGSGVAGLYSAYNIKRVSPSTTFLILEKNKKSNGLGGRAGNETFCGAEVVTGAGIGRKRKDKLLYRLLQDLSIETEEMTFGPNYAATLRNNICDIPHTMERLKKKLEKNGQSETFRKFAKRELGSAEYERFLITSGFSDYEQEDVRDVLYNYGMDDNSSQFQGFRVKWKEMVKKMADIIGPDYFKYSRQASKISRIASAWQISTISGHTYIANKIIIATTISDIRELLPNHRIYKDIEGQPFTRVYGKFDKKSRDILSQCVKGTTIVPGPLQKIIPIADDKGIYMIAYSDNDSAVFLKTHLENTERNRHFFSRLVEQSLGIPINTLTISTMIHFYWEIGTHYYKPLNTRIWETRADFIDTAQRPEKDIIVVGEVVSLHQGWTEGALESVHKVVTKKWITQ